MHITIDATITENGPPKGAVDRRNYYGTTTHIGRFTGHGTSGVI